MHAHAHEPLQYKEASSRLYAVAQEAETQGSAGQVNAAGGSSLWANRPAALHVDLSVALVVFLFAALVAVVAVARFGWSDRRECSEVRS